MNAPQHIEGVDLWLCPCAECTALEYEASGGAEETGRTLTEDRHHWWPDHYPAGVDAPS